MNDDRPSRPEVKWRTVRVNTREREAYARHGSTIIPPSLLEPSRQSLVRFAFVHEQSRRTSVDAEPEVNTGQKTDSGDLASISELQNQISGLSLSHEQVLDLVAERAMTVTHASGAAIAITQGEAAICRSRAGSTAPELGVHLDPKTGLSGECLRSGEMLCCDDSEIDPRVNLTVCRELAIRSILAVPILEAQRVIGILEVFSARPRAFDQQDGTALQLLANVAANVDPISALRTDVSAGSAALSSVEFATGPKKFRIPAPVTTRVQLASQKQVEPPPSRPAETRLNNFPIHALRRKSRLLRGVLLLTAIAGVGLVALIAGRLFPAVVPMPASPREVTALHPPAPSLSAASEQQGKPAFLSEIRVHSGPERSNIDLDLSSPAEYQSGQLDRPQRIYFDLLNTRAAAGLVNSIRGLTSDDHLVRRVRLGPQRGGVTRIVLDLNRPCDYSSVISSSPPYRVMIEVHPLPATVNAARPLPSASIESSASGGSTGLAADATPTVRAMHIRIVIDPGHGGTDRGTVGPSGLEEKGLVLDVAQRLGNLARNRLGADVIYTRTGDYFVPLETRSAIANAASADLFVSIHANASESRSVRGVETFYMDSHAATREALLADEDDQSAFKTKVAGSRQLAADVQHALFTRLAENNPQLRNRGVKAAPLVVLVTPNMPSILSEISFMSSPSEERKLLNENYRWRIAEALYEGIATYLSNTRNQKHYSIERAFVGHASESSSQSEEQRMVSK